MFYVGQKVVCVDGDFPRWEAVRANYEPVEIPRAGVTYTVRELFDHDGAVYLRLDEIRNPLLRLRTGLLEPAFGQRRFRPVVQTDISIFQAMLTKYPSKRRQEA
ncbi:hypothetical protein [Enterovirga sp. CN4-39]|uniref:hypothetical protein n=1 Tax=Enterovirga sp. CN4-39 TaxID=3400910 RepID=UPI003C0FAABE